MSNYTPTITLDTEFEGDKLKIVLKRLKREHMLQLLPLMIKAEGTDKMEMATSKVPEFMKTIASWVGDYFVSMEGLKDEDEKPINFETVCSEQYFFVLFQEVGMALMSDGRVIEADEKNLEGQSENIISVA